MEEIQLDMSKNKYDIAGLKILMTTYHQRTRRQAKPYLSKEWWDDEMADGVIDLGQKFYEEQHDTYLKYSGYDEIEYIYTGALFNRFLIPHTGCMLHSSAVVVDDYAYLFSADSGTGKSTHTNLWLKHFGDRAFIINDDKPAIRKIEDTWYVYGTPWSGKTDINVNTRVKLGAIVFLERSKDNWIEEMSIKEAIPKFLNQTVRKLKAEEKMDMVLKNMEMLLLENPIYKMGCNINDEAVVTAYEKIRRV